MNEMLLYVVIALVGGLAVGYHIGYARGDFMAEWAYREYRRQWDKALREAGDAALSSAPIGEK